MGTKLEASLQHKTLQIKFDIINVTLDVHYFYIILYDLLFYSVSHQVV